MHNPALDAWGDYDRAVRLNLREQWVRIVSVVIAPRVECRFVHLDPLDLAEA